MNAFELSNEVEDFKKNYSDLETKLLSAVGQKVLVVENWAGRSGISTKMRLGVLISRPRTGPYRQDALEVKFTELGILKALETDMNYNLILPMEKHAEISDNRYGSPKWKLNNGSIIISPYELMNLGQNAEHSIGSDGCFSSALRISKPAFVFETGESVEMYFRFHSVASRYGRKTLQETAEFLKNRQDNEQWMDLSYVEALDLLGLPAPEDFRRKYDVKIFGKKTEIVKKLYELSVREPQLKKDIERITQNCKGIPYEGDEVFVTFKQRGQLIGVYSERGRLLEEASQLGINDWNEKVDLAPGLSVIASDFLKGVREYHSKIVLEQNQRN